MMGPAAGNPTTIDRARLNGRLRTFRSAARCFVAVGSIVGLSLVFITPLWAGIDEPGHFYRAYQLTEGRLIPVEDPTGVAEGGGACLPTDVVADVEKGRLDYLAAGARDAGTFSGETPEPDLSNAIPCGEDRVFVEFATFSWYSPLGYAPQALAVGVGRLVGAPVSIQLVLARLATLAAYAALALFAIGRTPRGKWAMAAAALLPVTLFQAATSLSPDAVTVALVMVMVSSALRAADPELMLDRRTVLAEAAISCGLLALAKPTYVLLAVVYAVAFVGPRRRLDLWPVALPVLVAVAASMAWHQALSHLFACDVRFFDVYPDAGEQLSNIASSPHGFAGAVFGSVVDYGATWVEDSIEVGGRVLVWWAWSVIVAFVGFVVVGLQASDHETLTLHWSQRLVLLGSALVGLFAVIGGWLLHCSPVGLEVVNAPHVRLLVPIVPLVLIGVAPRRAPRPLDSARAELPVALALVPFYVVWLVCVGLRMH
ncbi:MAG: hypothetical protein JJLCMIEE_01654 [Acidimicrobiales bacterium]|nr:MAG: DUF2142 domain-containing protein [Actinomycetota bacterium]MBV6508589.1 hypothetical protein [Acidimicrobiales bacterium]RIK05107.1 MAG: hypothetical protein DCC48_10790 [Acidobacteriota bacterium]